MAAGYKQLILKKYTFIRCRMELLSASYFSRTSFIFLINVTLSSICVGVTVWSSKTSQELHKIMIKIAITCANWQVVSFQKKKSVSLTSLQFCLWSSPKVWNFVSKLTMTNLGSHFCVVCVGGVVNTASKLVVLFCKPVKQIWWGL